MLLRGLAVAFTCSHGHETVSYPEDGSLMLLQTRASMMKIAVDNGTEESPVELVDVKTAGNLSSDAVSNASITSEKVNGTTQQTVASATWQKLMAQLNKQQTQQTWQ